jgi:peptide/nickel transport system ATP-binding protein
MYAGQIVERGPAEQMIFDPLHPYSKGLMGSIIVPEEGTREVKLTAIPGTPPNLKAPPEGCRFAARCQYKESQCQLSQRIAFSDVGNDRGYRCLLTESKLREVYANG